MKPVILVLALAAASAPASAALLDHGSNTRWYAVDNEMDGYKGAAIQNAPRDLELSFQCAEQQYMRSLTIEILKVTDAEECVSHDPPRIVPVTFTMDGKPHQIPFACYRSDLGASISYFPADRTVAGEKEIKALAAAMDKAKTRSMRIESADGLIDTTVTLNGSSATQRIFKLCAYPKGM